MSRVTVACATLGRCSDRMPADNHLRNKIQRAIALRAIRLPVTQFPRMFGLGLLLLVTCVFLGYWFLWGPGGDPGGRVLHQLQPAAQAIPSDAHVIYRYDLEPKWDSCDGRQGTFGWDNVIVQIHFESRTPTIALVGNADKTLRRLGWSQQYYTNGQAGWRKQLANGSVANAQLSNVVPGQGGLAQTWDLFVGAPPIGTRVSGC
jgi:hypothetical protein